MDGFLDAYSSLRKILFGYTEKEKEQMKPVSNYLSIIEKAKIEKQRKIDLKQIESDRFSGRYTSSNSLEDLAKQKASNILNDTVSSNVSSFDRNSNSESGLLLVGFISLFVILLFKK